MISDASSVQLGTRLETGYIRIYNTLACSYRSKVRKLDTDIIDLIIYVFAWFMQKMVGSSSRV